MINLESKKWVILRFYQRTRKQVISLGEATAVDKYEYKIRSEEIKALIAQGEYADAAAIADTIDWRRVKSVMMLCTVSDLYKINRRLEDARDMLLLAYDRHPGGRSIVYSLCELSIKMGEFVQAVEYYKEFVQVAPKDSGRYVLQYKLYEAQDVSLEERIEVLEELKSKDYSEKWAYELAYLYHRVGLATRCVEECDELIVWFGEGKYVLKAMELKKLHEPLTDVQQAKYNEMKGISRPVEQPAAKEPQVPVSAEPDLADAPTREIPQKELDIQVKLMGVGQYDTINMQKELAQNMKELWEGPSAEEMEQAQESFAAQETEQADQEETVETDADSQEIDSVTQAIIAPLLNSDTDIIDVPDEETEEEPVEPEETKVEEVFFGETGELDNTATQVMEAMKQETLSGEKVLPVEETAEKEELADDTGKPITATPAGDMTEWHVGSKPTGFEKILGMEYDGQISMIMPDSEQVEKQITGQIRLEDVLLEWEKMKKDSEQKRMEAVRQRVMEQTGAMFTEFEAATRDGLLEQLEKGTAAGEAKEEAADDLEIVEEAAEEADAEAEVTEETEDPGEEDFGEVEELEEIAEVEEQEPVVADEQEALDDTEVFDEAEALDEVEDIEEAETPDEAEDIEEAETPDEVEDIEEAEAYEEEADQQPQAAEESEEVMDLDEPQEVVEEEEPAGKEPVGEENAREEAPKAKVRSLSPEERRLFGSYIQSRGTRDQIIHAIDNISMAAYTGNVIITGEEGMDTMTLAKNLIKEVQQTDSNFSGKIAKISGDSLNRKGIEQPFAKLVNGALIVQKAGALKKETIEKMLKALEQEHSGFIVVLEDTKKAMNKLLKDSSSLTQCFNIRIDIEALDNDTLVAYGKKYAREQEYSIDELGVLALHTCIADRQTSDHAVTLSEVKEIMDEAIRHANRKTLGHFFDILVAKRYDEEDMIILREKDFM